MPRRSKKSLSSTAACSSSFIASGSEGAGKYAIATVTSSALNCNECATPVSSPHLQTHLPFQLSAATLRTPAAANARCPRRTHPAAKKGIARASILALVNCANKSSTLTRTRCAPPLGASAPTASSLLHRLDRPQARQRSPHLLILWQSEEDQQLKDRPKMLVERLKMRRNTCDSSAMLKDGCRRRILISIDLLRKACRHLSGRLYL